MSASLYPKLLDTDVQLLRRTPADAIVPGDHNNLVDAIQSVESVLGMTDDGTAGGGAQHFRLTAAHLAGLRSTAIRDPRFPWVPSPTNAWYPQAGSRPAGWTLGANVTESYTTLPGWIDLAYTASAAGLLASCPLNGTAPYDLFVSGFQGKAYVDQTFKFEVGFSANGTGTDVDGVRFIGPTVNTLNWYVMVNGAQPTGNPGGGLDARSGVLWVHNTGTVLSYQIWNPAGLWLPLATTYAPTGTATKLVIYCTTKPAGTDHAYLGFVAQGSTTPFTW